ncbi:hypothetical protein [Nonomuraea rosea]|uniref:hypothetical protein n=1 Tax=Nonomuraea rosea TaxID=638574 RepID=UPI0031EEAADC
MIVSSGENPSPRLLPAAVAGIILPVGLFAWAALMTRFFPDSHHCGEYTGCIGFLAEAWDVGRWVAIVLAWPLLHLLRVRPAWPVAVLAGAFLLVIWWVAGMLRLDHAFTVVVFSGLLAYPAAAWPAGRMRISRRMPEPPSATRRRP